jgi:hypothetical protein
MYVEISFKTGRFHLQGLQRYSGEAWYFCRMIQFQTFKPGRYLFLSLPLIGGLFFSSACKKSDPTPAPVNASLNATETAIEGRWYVAETDDTTVTYTFDPKPDTAIRPSKRVDYTSANYIDFQPTVYTALKAQLPEAKNLTDARRGVAGTSYWYVDATNKLVIQGLQFDIISQTATDLQVRSVLESTSATTKSKIIQNARFKRR